jgi:hypothetical protein
MEVWSQQLMYKGQNRQRGGFFSVGSVVSSARKTF